MVVRPISLRPRDTVANPLVVYTLEDLLAASFPEQRILLARGDMALFRAGHLSEIYGMRGTGKTWFAMTLALVIASDIKALGFHNPSGPARVLWVDGDMSKEDIQSRFARLVELLHVPHDTFDNLVIISADGQHDFLPRLDTREGRMVLEPYLTQTDCVFLENRSTLFDPESETDPAKWQPAQDLLLSLRRRCKAVQVVHHSNRQGGARGHSKPEDVMNLLIKLTRPEQDDRQDGAQFIVEYDKVRGAYGPALAPFRATLGPSGWTTTSVATDHIDTALQKLREYLALAHAAADRPTSANAAIQKAGVNRRNGLKAWSTLLKAGVLRTDTKGGFFLDE